MNISEETFDSWSKGPSDTEAAKCENAEAAVRKAIKANKSLQDLDISVFAQGSYRARTNVRQNSDVDICIRYNSTFFPKYPDGTTRESFGHEPGTMKFLDFKDMVQVALEDYFGEDGVTRGNKAFTIHANSYRIDADVVPTFEHRWYTGRKNNDGSNHYHSGVAFDPETGSRIINWPDQTYNNGIKRNDETLRRYKRTIRIIKRLRDKMQEDEIAEAKNIASFLIESLVWNANVEAFSKETHTARIRYVIADLWKRSQKDEDCDQWMEVNEFKNLFRPSQPWSRVQSNAFLFKAWNYIGYK